MFNVGDLVICNEPYKYGVTDIGVVCEVVRSDIESDKMKIKPVEILNEYSSRHIEYKKKAIEDEAVYTVYKEYFKLYKKKKSTNVK